VPDLEFAIRNVAMLQICGEIRVSCNAGHAQTQLLRMRPQVGTSGRGPIQNGQVWTLGHQHHAIETEIRSLVQELFHGKKVLPQEPE